jgi:hypothetical protein
VALATILNASRRDRKLHNDPPDALSMSLVLAGRWPPAGLCYAAIGTDTEGSIRFSVSVNGVVC